MCVPADEKLELVCVRADEKLELAHTPADPSRERAAAVLQAGSRRRRPRRPDAKDTRAKTALWSTRDSPRAEKLAARDRAQSMLQAPSEPAGCGAGRSNEEPSSAELKPHARAHAETKTRTW